MNESVNVRAQLSPGVDIEKSNFIPSTLVEPSLNTAAFVGEFEKGPVNEPILITDALQFKIIFGRATETNYNDWYQIYNYLQYGNSKILVCRSIGLNKEKANNNGNIANSYGSWGNLLTIEIHHKTNLTNTIKDIFGILDIEKNNINDYFIIIKRKEKIVETFNINNSDELNSNYLENINLEEGIFVLSGGYSDSPANTDIKESLELFSKENYDIDILISSEYFDEENIELAESRKDCVVFLGIPRRFVYFLVLNGLVLTTESGVKIAAKIKNLNLKITENDIADIKKYVSKLNKSSYAFCVFGFKVQYDAFTGKNRIINVIGDIAGLKSAASLINPWSIGCGIERGTIRNYERFTMIIKKEDKDELYRLGVNTLEGNSLMSQKLLVNESFSIQKLHHRNIYNYLKRTSEKIINRYIFNQNERFLRQQLALDLKRLLEDMQLSRGIEAGKVVVTVNSPTIDVNSININIYIKMINIAEIVKVNFINAGTRDLTEIVQTKEI